MKKAIIHISDLHVTHFLDSDGKKQKSINSWLNTNPDDSFVKLYVDEFIATIYKGYKDFELYLVLTGDVSDKAVNEEFDYSGEFLNNLCNKLKISKERVLIIPGDHDVNRNDCRNAYDKGLELDSKKFAYEYHDEKFKKFKLFYDKFYEGSRIFDVEKSIVNYLNFDNEKILLVGLNSNGRIGTIGGDGFIDNDRLSSELNELITNFNDYSKIALFHHNFIANHEDKAMGNWDKDNLIQVTQTLEKFEFKVYLYGNEHTPSSCYKNLVYHINNGTFSCKKPVPSFKVYVIESAAELSINLNLYKLQNDGHNHNHEFGYWGKIDNPKNEEAKIILLSPISSSKVSDQYKEILLPESKQIEIPINYYNKSDFSDELFRIIKEKKLFHTGHFHWSETSRAHNWIDVSKILNNNNDLFLAKNAILDVINKCEIAYKFDFVIGLGIEGTILSTRTVVKYASPFSFLPYSYRYDEHNNYEKDLNFKNEGKYKSVLIITDVVHDGRTLRKLINKREKEFFKGVEKIYVISLFYTGEDYTHNPNILNSKNILKFDISTDHEEDRIEYYYVLQLKVEECPYGSNYREDCLVVKEGLGCIYKFYDEEKAWEKRKGKHTDH